MKITCLLYTLLILSLCWTCKQQTATTLDFQGEPQAIVLANQMYDAIGGKERWCDLKALYIKAQHTEPQMDQPYASEIWRAIDHFKIMIQQQNDAFHVVAKVDSTGGRVTYLDQRDTFRVFTPEQLANWQHDHEHNIYVLLHKLGCRPQHYTVKTNNDQRLTFYRDTSIVVAFEMDELKRPHLFYHPNSSGEIIGSRFTHWGTDAGLVHSAGGHPLDSNFMYRTEIWQPSNVTFDEVFKDVELTR